MKLQCTIGEHPINGFYHADPVTNEEFNGNYIEVLKIFEPGELTEIYAPQLIDYLNWDNLTKVLSVFREYLRIGGKITLGGTEVSLLCKKVVSREMTVEQFNMVCFSRIGKVAGFVPILKAKELLKELNMRILEVNINENNMNYTIVAERQ